MKFKKPDREITEAFLHHSATDNPNHDNINWIRKIHVEQNGWSDVGYHYFIKADGSIEEGRNLETQPAAQYGHNTGTIAICLSGLGQSFTEEQEKALRNLCNKINDAYEGNIVFRGHKEVNHTECPHYDYIKMLGLIGGKIPYTKPWWKEFFSSLLS